MSFSESAHIFIHYLSATANDICKGSKRQTINDDDVLKALENIEFPKFIEPLKASLEGLREREECWEEGRNIKGKGSEHKRGENKGSEKKRKLEEPPPKEEEEEEEENKDEDGGDGASESLSKELMNNFF